MKKFIVDFEGEEEAPDQHATFLPRYIYTGGDTRNWATERARASWSPDKPMWIAKILIHSVYDKRTGEWMHKEPPVVAWSVLTDVTSYKGLSHLYYIDTKGTFPEVAGSQGEVIDVNGMRGIIELASEPEPAPWWERPSKNELIETVMSMLDVVEIEDLVRVAEFLAMVPPRGVVWGDLFDAIESNLRANWEAGEIDRIREWIEENIDIEPRGEVEPEPYEDDW